MTENEKIEPMLAHLSQLRQRNSYDYTRLFFDRLLPLFTLYEDLWQMYIELTLEQAPQHSYSVHTRALKNLYFSADIWLSYARC